MNLATVVAVGLAGLVACSGSHHESEPSETSICRQGPLARCTHASAACELARATCDESSGTPGPCICQQASAITLGPIGLEAPTIEAGAFHDGTFYWSEVVVGFGRPFSRIVSERDGVIVAKVEGLVQRLVVTDEAIYAQDLGGREGWTFSPSGENGYVPPPADAFDVPTGHVTSDSMGVFWDEQLLADRAVAVAEVRGGVYYVPASKPYELRFVQADDTSSDALIAVQPVGKIIGVWASGTDVYLRTIEPVGDSLLETEGLRHVDAAIIGQD